ncbi:MAG: hypothetical protein KAV82_15505 [Phycisphaerae bacterium]|nr:hypothetical protein [Phycisphaerae bacterium]
MQKPPPNRRNFIHEWDEIDYLHEKLGYWLETRQSRYHARRFVTRLKELVSRKDPKHEVILGAACRAAIANCEQNLSEEIHYTKHYISLLRELLKDGFECPYYDWSAVRNETAVLAVLYAESGQAGLADKTILEVKRLCSKHGLSFAEEKLRKQVFDSLRE